MAMFRKKRHNTDLVLPLVLLLLVLPNFHCAADPRARVAVLRQGYNLALNTASDLHDQGKLTASQATSFYAAQAGADVVITALEAQAASTQPSTPQSDLDAAAALLTAMNNALQGAK